MRQVESYPDKMHREILLDHQPPWYSAEDDDPLNDLAVNCVIGQ